MSDPVETAKRADKESLLDDVFFAFLAIVPIGLFLAIIYNRFLPIEDAWGEGYGGLMKQGKIPYRDFYYFTQPFFLLIQWAIVEASDKLIYFRYYGCAERLTLTIALYWLLRQQFSAMAAFVGTCTAIMGMTSFDADGMLGYFYTSLLFLVLAIGFLVKAVNATPQSRACLLWSGFFVSLSFFTKQSIGLVMCLTFFCVILIISENLKTAWSRLVSFGAGFSLAGLPFLTWIVSLNVSRSYYEQVFFNAESQKGGLLTIFTSFFSRLPVLADLGTFLVLGTAAWLLSKRKLLSFLPFADGEGAGRPARVIPLLTALFIGIILLASVCMDWFIPADRLVTFVPPFVFSVLLVLAFYLLAKRASLVCDQRFASKGMIVMVIGSLGIMYGTGMSYQIQEHALVPALGICVGLLMDHTRLKNPWLMRFIVILLCTIFIQCAATKKYGRTFAWYGWNENIFHETSGSSIPRLGGFIIDPHEDLIYRRICEIIEKNCNPDDTVFTFPLCPMFNYLTDHPQPTFALVHYWDVCPDKVALADAHLLEATPPKVIVWMKAPAADIRFQENAFRNGHESGYSHLTSTLGKLTLGPDYQLMGVFQHNANCYPVEVWVRRTGSDDGN